MKRTALIGYTGFVGGNIASAVGFDDYYNSKNIETIKGKKYDLIVSAGVRAEKWWANQNPDEDWKGIKTLIDNLKDVKSNHFLLISTVDVYPEPLNVYEDTIIDKKKLQPYGFNRLKLEYFVKNTFPNYHIVRLPGLFGKGLKKNFIYDIINDQYNNFVHPKSVFQFYDLSRIGKDINIVLKEGLKIVNFATEPVSVKEITVRIGLKDFTGNNYLKILKYDVKSKYAHLFGGKGFYFENKKIVLDKIKEFIKKNKQ
jgi:nucleoside-diphosphate-sugar epimerase